MNDLSFFARFLAGSLVTGASATVPDFVIVDLLIAVLGGFLAAAPNGSEKHQLWECFAGICLGVVVMLIARSGDFGDFTVRIAIFVAAIMSTKGIAILRSADSIETIRKIIAVLIKKS